MRITKKVSSLFIRVENSVYRPAERHEEAQNLFLLEYLKEFCSSLASGRILSSFEQAWKSFEET